jgi:hypothetical protein
MMLHSMLVILSELRVISSAESRNNTARVRSRQGVSPKRSAPAGNMIFAVLPSLAARAIFLSAPPNLSAAALSHAKPSPALLLGLHHFRLPYSCWPLALPPLQTQGSWLRRVTYHPHRPSHQHGHPFSIAHGRLCFFRRHHARQQFCTVVGSFVGTCHQRFPLLEAGSLQ